MNKTKENIDQEDSFINKTEHKLIFKKFKPIKKIGSGSFSSVYICENILSKKYYAMKVENREARYKYLQNEAYNLLELKNFGIPEYISFGHTKTHNILVQSILGKSICKILKEIGKKFELIDVCLLALQILERIEWVHSKNLIHRDIKPENFLFGIKDPYVLYLIDFGLCKKYRSSKTGKHIIPKYTGKFNGTVKYASINSLKGKESSRRDDLISIGYLLICLATGDLPWEDRPLSSLNKAQYLKMIKDRESIKPQILCENLPKEFSSYIKYVYSLKFEQDPNYSYLKSLFKQFLNNSINNPKNDFIFFSWLKNQKINFFKLRRSNSKRSTSPQNNLLKKIKQNLENKKNTDSIKEINNTSEKKNEFNSINKHKYTGNLILLQNSGKNINFSVSPDSKSNNFKKLPTNKYTFNNMKLKLLTPKIKRCESNYNSNNDIEKKSDCNLYNNIQKYNCQRVNDIRNTNSQKKPSKMQINKKILQCKTPIQNLDKIKKNKKDFTKNISNLKLNHEFFKNKIISNNKTVGKVSSLPKLKENISNIYEKIDKNTPRLPIFENNNNSDRNLILFNFGQGSTVNVNNYNNINYVSPSQSHIDYRKNYKNLKERKNFDKNNYTEINNRRKICKTNFNKYINQTILFVRDNYNTQQNVKYLKKSAKTCMISDNTSYTINFNPRSNY